MTSLSSKLDSRLSLVSDTMRILVIEDDPAIRDLLKRGLSEASYVTDQAMTARTAERLVCDQDYAAIVLDLGLPDCDGLDRMTRLRSQGVMAPMLILSTRRSVTDRVRGLEQGGDDFLTKPFAFWFLQNFLANDIQNRSDSWLTGELVSYPTSLNVPLEIASMKSRFERSRNSPAVRLRTREAPQILWRERCFFS